MKVIELIKILKEFDKGENVKGIEVGRSDNVTEVIGIDEKGKKVKYPTIIIGDR